MLLTRPRTHKPIVVMRKQCPLCSYSDRSRATAQNIAMGQGPTSKLLFDYLIGHRQQAVGCRDPQGFRRPEVEHEHEFAGLLNRQVRRLLAAENFAA